MQCCDHTYIVHVSSFNETFSSFSLLLSIVINLCAKRITGRKIMYLNAVLIHEEN